MGRWQMMDGRWIKAEGERRLSNGEYYVDTETRILSFSAFGM